MRTLDEQAHLDFALLLRRRWADMLYPALRGQYEAALDGAPEPEETKAARPVVHAQPAWPWFAWLERSGQKMLWRAVQDSVAAYPPEARDEAGGPATLGLDPALDMPAWDTIGTSTSSPAASGATTPRPRPMSSARSS